MQPQNKPNKIECDKLDATDCANYPNECKVGMVNVKNPDGTKRVKEVVKYTTDKYGKQVNDPLTGEPITTKVNVDELEPSGCVERKKSDFDNTSIEGTLKPYRASKNVPKKYAPVPIFPVNDTDQSSGKKKDVADTAETELDEIKIKKTKRRNIIDAKIQQSEFDQRTISQNRTLDKKKSKFNQQAKSKFKTLDKKKKALPLKNNVYYIRRLKFKEVDANGLVLDSIENAVQVLKVPGEGLSTTTYQHLNDLVNYLKVAWKTRSKHALSPIWKTTDALGNIYDQTFASYKVRTFTIDEQDIVVAIYNLLAHISNYRAEQYIYKTDVTSEDVVFNWV